jgi:hypothetical protein
MTKMYGATRRHQVARGGVALRQRASNRSVASPREAHLQLPRGSVVSAELAIRLAA